MAGSLQERVRSRLRELAESLGFSQTRIAEHLHIDRSAVSKLFAPSGTALCLDYLEEFAFLFQRSPAELIADENATIMPVSPLEAQLVSRARQMSELQRQSLLAVLDWQRVADGRRKRTRAEAFATTGVDAEVLGLFHALDGDESAQAAVLAVMRAHPAATRPKRV